MPCAGGHLYPGSPAVSPEDLAPPPPFLTAALEAGAVCGQQPGLLLCPGGACPSAEEAGCAAGSPLSPGGLGERTRAELGGPGRPLHLQVVFSSVFAHFLPGSAHLMPEDSAALKQKHFENCRRSPQRGVTRPENICLKERPDSIWLASNGGSVWDYFPNERWYPQQEASLQCRIHDPPNSAKATGGLF